jgi:hypothetical protein
VSIVVDVVTGADPTLSADVVAAAVTALIPRAGQRYQLACGSLHRQGQDFAGAHEAFLTDELARRVRRPSGSAQARSKGRAHPASWQPPWERS